MTELVFSARTFKHKNNSVNFSVYRGQKRPSGDDGKLGDVFCEGDEVWMKGKNGWEKYEMNEIERQRNRHPEYKQHVLNIKEGHCNWKSLGTLRSVRSREKDAGKKILHKNKIVHENASPLPPLASSSRELSSLLDKGLPHSLNDWLKVLRKRWTEPPLTSFPHSAQGSRIFDALLSLSHEIPLFPTMEATKEIYSAFRVPTMEHIITDIITLPQDTLEVIDVAADAIIPGLSKAAFIAAMIMSHSAEWTPSSRMYSIHSLLCQPSGTLQCQLKIPSTFKDRAIAETDGRVPRWVSSVCPAGTLTNIHVDYHGSAQLMVNVTCDKLWLLWPPTESNLLWWNSRHTRVSHGDTVCNAIAQLEGLELLHANGSQSFVLPPYHFHAVLTFEASAHLGVTLWGFAWWDTSRRGVEWEIKWASNHSKNGFSSEVAEGVLNAIQDESLKYWTEVINRFPKHELAETVKSWLISMKANIQDALAAIHASVETGKRKRSGRTESSKKRRND